MSSEQCQASDETTSHNWIVEDPRAEQLLDWFTNLGGWLNPDVRIVHDNSREFHVRAAKTLSSPTVATCPLSLTLSYLNLDHSQTAVPHVDSPLKNCLGLIPDHVLTYLLLVEQRCWGEKSLWHPYIACLPPPEAMSTPIWFTDEDMKCLQGTNLAQATRDRKEDLREQWIKACIVMQDAGVALPSESDFDLFRWAATIMTSRSFISHHILPDRPTFPILFPVIDILNHSVRAKVGWDFSPFKDFSLTILEDVYAGEEILNNYAPKQNDELLMGYGFSVPDNPMEQFTIRATIPPKVAKEMSDNDWFNKKWIPFNMSESCLDDDPANKQHFLRTRGHPLGRYDNMIPCFQGFAPYLVHASFLMVLRARGIDLTKVNLPNPGARIYLKTLQALYMAVENRCNSLPTSHTPSTTFPNNKQKYATIYREGQAKVIHTMRRELMAVLEKRRLHNATSVNPAIITTTEALFALKVDFPEHYENFKKGFETVWGARIVNSSDYARLVAQDLDNEDLVWVLLLIVFVTITLNSHHSTIYAWLQDLLSAYPLPTLPPNSTPITETDEACAYVHTLLSACSQDLNDMTWTAVANLDDLGRSISAEASTDLDNNNAAPPSIGSGPISRLREKVILWAVRVVDAERLELPDRGNGAWRRQCMYMRPWRQDRNDEDWIFDEVADIPEWDS